MENISQITDLLEQIESVEFLEELAYGQRRSFVGKMRPASLLRQPLGLGPQQGLNLPSAEPSIGQGSELSDQVSRSK